MNKNVERIVLEKVERLTRKNATATQSYTDLPKCTFLIHQPKRPKK